MKSSLIIEQIQSANLDEISKPTRGDCVSIASAIQEVYGGVILVFYLSMDREDVLHAVVEIDQVCYDGNGRVDFEQLLESSVISANINHHDEVEVIDSHLFDYQEDVSSIDIYTEDTKQEVLERLESVANK